MNVIAINGSPLLVLEVIGIQSTLPVLVLFRVLKTSSDVAAHIDKHLPKKYTEGTTTSP
jgi:hypothetical protein